MTLICHVRMREGQQLACVRKGGWAKAMTVKCCLWGREGGFNCCVSGREGGL